MRHTDTHTDTHTLLLFVGVFSAVNGAVITGPPTSVDICRRRL